MFRGNTELLLILFSPLIFRGTTEVIALINSGLQCLDKVQNCSTYDSGL